LRLASMCIVSNARS